MRKAHYIFFALIIAAFIYVQKDLNERLDRVKIAQMVSKIPRKGEPVNKIVTAKKQVPVAESIPFVTKFKAESLQIGKLQAKPELVLERLQKLAAQMQSKDVAQMYEIISDDKANADQRALAVELLSIKNDTASLTALQNFVANSKNINGIKWDRKKELETVLRAQAVESIAAFPEKEIALSTLSFLQQKVDQSFLSDRISRASMGLMTGAKPVPVQDNEALKKLVE